MDIQKLNDSIFDAKNSIESAKRFLKLHGLRVLHTGFVTPLGSLDIVATDDIELIIGIVIDENEVLPYQALTKKIDDLSKATAAYVKRFGLKDVDVRLDLIKIDKSKRTVLYQKNAFDCYLNYTTMPF